MIPLKNRQLLLNNYGIGTFTGVPAYNLSTTALGNVIETTAGLFGTAFRATLYPPNITTVAPSLNATYIPNGVTIKPTVDYQLVNGVTTTMYDVATGIWTCPQTGKYDINYNVYLTAPAGTYGWGETALLPGQFFIGVTNNGNTIYFADYCTVTRQQYLKHIMLTGSLQGVNLNGGTPLVLKIINMTGVSYTTLPSPGGDNIDWTIRRVG